MFVDDDDYIYKNASGFGQSGGYDAIATVVSGVAGGLLMNQQAKKQRQAEMDIAQAQLALQKELGLAAIKSQAEVAKQRNLTDSLTSQRTVVVSGGGSNSGKTIIYVLVGVAMLGAIGFSVYKMKKK